MIQKLTRSLFLAFASILAGVSSHVHVHADILFDLTPMPGDFVLTDFDHRGNLTRDGIKASFTGHSDEGLFEILGKLVFTSTNFGVSIDDSTDQDPTLIDVGNSDTFGLVPERMLISFDQSVSMEEITLRHLADGANARLLNPENPLQVYADLTGTSSEFDTFDLTSSNILLAPGQQIAVAYSTGSFAMKSFRVSAVPEPGMTGLLAIGAVGLTIRRRKK